VLAKPANETLPELIELVSKTLVIGQICPRDDLVSAFNEVNSPREAAPPEIVSILSSMQKDQAEIVRRQNEMVDVVQDEMSYLSNEVAELQIDNERIPQQRYGSQFQADQDAPEQPIQQQNLQVFSQHRVMWQNRSPRHTETDTEIEVRIELYHQSREGYHQNRGGYHSRGGFQQFNGRNQQFRCDFQQQYGRGYGSTRANGLCYSCGKFGHFIRDCWLREPQRPSAQNAFFSKN
jgi:hypothetical protein